MSKRRIILIGGAPLSGKSTLASALSKKLHIPWVSTDDIRKWMQTLVRQKDYPDLFHSVGIGAAEFYKKHTSPQEVLQLELQEGLDVQKGIAAMIDSFLWWDEFIIEGIAISPSFVKQFQDSHMAITVTSLFLVDRDKENIKKRIDTRGLWGDTGTYPDDIKPAELQWTALFNKYYEREATKYGCLVHDITELNILEKAMQ